MRAMGRAETHASRAKARGLPRARLTFAAFPFMLPVLVDEVPEGPDWVFELKLDGVRVLALRAHGRPSFQLLQRRMHTSRPVASVPIVAYLYDCLALRGRDLRGLGLRDRKARLRELVPAIDPLRDTDHFEGDGEGFFRAACEAGLEGVIAKRADG